MTSSIKKRMEQADTVFGTWCMLYSSFVVIDMEPRTLSLETAEKMVRAAQVHPIALESQIFC